MLRILHNTKIDFIRVWKQAAIGIALFVLPGLLWVAISNFRYSIEFTGGTLMQLEFTQPPDVGAIRTALTEAGLGSAEIATFGNNELIIRAQGTEATAQQASGAEAVSERIREVLTQRLGANTFRVVRGESVGPRIGGELRRQATVSMLIAFGLTLIYLAWRFEWRFAVAAVLATVHDIFATLAFMKYMNLEISVFVVGAILTVIGYSMNDKVVVFDRVRENLRASKREPLYDLLNRSVNETLPRTVMTGSTTLACLVALLVFGGDVIRPFAWVLTWGILVGTFSSIYVAAPLLLWIERKYPKASVDKAHVSAAQARAEPAGEAAPPRRGSREGLRSGQQAGSNYDRRLTRAAVSFRPMPEYIDSHAHLADPAFDADREAIIGRARDAGALGIIAIGESLGAADRAEAIAGSHTGFVHWTAGVHPHDAAGFDPRADPDRIRDHLSRGAVAVGECGLDYHYDHSPRDLQRRAFAAQLALAAETMRPVVVHTREAAGDTAAMVAEAGHAGISGVLHCFSGPASLAEVALAAGWYISFSGIVTFKRWADDDLIRLIPDDRLLTETDAPYLAPVPHRGKRNEPAFLPLTVAHLARAREQSIDHVGARTVANAIRLFGLASARAAS